MLDMSHKTLFLLDHTFQMREPCGIPIELDNASRQGQGSRNQYFASHIPPVTRSLWTTVVENVMEYSRILWDVYGDTRLFRVLLSNPQSTETVNEWNRAQQNTVYMSETFANAGPPLKNTGSVQNGIKSAIAALQEPSEIQEELMNGNKCCYQIPNKGRVVCFTTHHIDTDLAEYFQATLNEQNKAVAGSRFSLPVQECEFTLISVHPMGKERKVRIATTALHEVSSVLKTEVWVVSPDRLYDKMIELCMRHHDLVITTVTGIPMKEEMNSTSSSNYDVALLHPRLSTTSSDTSVLKWSAQTTQKGTGLGTTNPCSTACRITPVDVNSRPSTCLSNFVVGGRSVWLDMFKKGKFISHVLTSHGGEMWMHIMETSRNILEAPPSVSEGIGGRVTDYRIPDFVEFMKLNMLIPYGTPGENQLTSMNKVAPVSIISEARNPNDMAKARLSRKSEFWPITISGSLLIPMALHIESLLNLMPRDTLSDVERLECETKLFALMAIENRGDPPPLPSAHLKKGQKRDDQWRSVYAELESFIRANLHSENHRKILHCFLESRPGGSGNGKAEKRLTDSDLLGGIAGNTKLIIADSPMSPPPQKKARLDDFESNDRPCTLNLLELWRKKTQKTDLRALPRNLKLYPNIRAEDKEKSGKDKRDRQGQDKSSAISTK